MSDEQGEDFGKAVYGPGPCGHANTGDAVVFSFRSRDGSEHRFHCHAAELPAIIRAMADAGATAAAARSGQPDGGILEVSRPLFVVADPELTILQKDNLEPLVGVRLHVHEGFPLVFAMDHVTAKTLAEGLLEATAGSLPPPPTRQ